MQNETIWIRIIIFFIIHLVKVPEIYTFATVFRNRDMDYIRFNTWILSNGGVKIKCLFMPVGLFKGSIFLFFITYAHAQNLYQLFLFQKKQNPNGSDRQERRNIRSGGSTDKDSDAFCAGTNASYIRPFLAKKSRICPKT